MDIQKKILSVFDRKVRIEFFDTDTNLLFKELTKGKIELIFLVYYKICNAIIFVVDFQKDDSFDFIKDNIKNFLVYSNATLAMIGINFDNKTQFDQVFKFCESYSIQFIPLEDYSYFTEENYIIENLLGLFLVKKINKIKKVKKQEEIKVKQGIDVCSYTSNYKIDETENKDNFIPPKIYRKYSGKV